MMTAIIQFLVLTVALFVCAQYFASKILRSDDFISKLLAAFIMFFTLIALIYEATGFSSSAHGISIKNTSVAVFFLIIVVFLIKSKLSNSIITLTSPNIERMSIWTITTLIVSVALLILFAANALTAPPAPTDAFLDHLVFPAEWLKAGRIFPVQTLSPDQATTYYPSNSELVYLWLMLPFHDDLLTGILEPICLFLCWLASCRIFIRIGLTRNAAMSTAAVAACVPGVTIMTLHSGVDLFFAFAVLSTAAFLIPDRDGYRNDSVLAIAGLAAGLAIGTKYVGLVTIIFLFPLIFAGVKKQSILNHGKNFLIFCFFALVSGGFWYFRNLILTGSPLYPMGVKVGGMYLMKGAFYRDAMFNAYLHISSGNIKYFLNVLLNVLLGKWVTIFVPIVYVAYRVVFGSKSQKLYSIIFSLIVIISLVLMKTGNDSGRSGVIILMVCFIAFSGLLYTSTDGPWWKKYLALMGPILIFAFWFINPYNTANNYRFMVPAVFFIAGFLFPKKHSKYGSIALFMVSFLTAASNLETISRYINLIFSIFRPEHSIWQYEAAMTGLYAILFCGFLVVSVALAISSKMKISFIFIALAAVALPLFLTAKNKNMETGRYQWYASHFLAAGWNALSKIDDPVNVAYSGNCSPYGLYGNKLKNNVKYINLDGRSNLIFHHYEMELRNKLGYIMPVESVGLNYIFRRNADYYKWFDSLIEEKIDILYVTKEFYRGIITEPIELQWARQNPDNFKPIFIRGDTFAFLVLK